jgi:dimethylamine monooxygenase subunit A
MTAVLHKILPFAPWADPRTRRLPGVLPVEGGDWLRADEAYAGQMALRDRLIAEVPERVHALLPEGRAAAGELLERVVAGELPRLGYSVSGEWVTRPDGVRVRLDRAEPLLTLGQLVQEDFCLHLKQGDEHVLVGAVLCFPAGWTLAEKIGQPLSRIHRPVDRYDADIARRVQRMFDAIRPEQPLWRANGLIYSDPELFYPRTEAAPRKRPEDGVGYVRSERQCFVKLPVSGAVVFSIHTYLLDPADLTAEQAGALAEHPLGRAGG